MDVTKMNAKLLTKELSQRGLATHDLTPALTERLEQTINNQPESISNDEFHALNKNATSDDGKIAEKEQRIAELKAGNKAELKAEEAELAEAKHHRAVTQRKLKDLEPRLSVSPKLPTSVLLSILGQLGKKAGERAACVKREWRDVVGTAKALGMYRTKVFSVVAGGGGNSRFTIVCTAVGLFSCGGRSQESEAEYDSDTNEYGHEMDPDMPALGHSGEGTELVPRMIEALADKAVTGVAAGKSHAAVWTEAGELFTFGEGEYGRLGHGRQEHELVPRLVEALVGKDVIGAAAGKRHTAVWTDTGELFTFGHGQYGRLGHGGTQVELVPRMIEALAGKKVVGAAAGREHTVVWTDAGELFTFGCGQNWQLGHGGQQKELLPRLVEALAGKKVTGALAGQKHTAVWTDAGELFTFGEGDHGNLGHGKLVHEWHEPEHVPRLVEALAGKKVLGAAGTGNHTVVWTEAGELFTFGFGGAGQLGHDYTNDERVPDEVRRQDTESTPRLVESLVEKKIVGAAACGAHTAVWTDEGEVFTFGSGNCGQLGHGGTEFERVPRLITDAPWEA